MTIFLIGFMGSGKTTMGAKLAARMGYKYIDLDKEIEQVEGQSIREIIDNNDELFFRDIEAKILRQIALTDAVIATGGGTPCYHDNIDWMNANGTTVYLEMNEGVLFSRLKSTDLSNRPLVRGLDDEGLKQFIHTKLIDREPYYMQANIIFDPVKESLADLVLLLRSYLYQ